MNEIPKINIGESISLTGTAIAQAFTVSPTGQPLVKAPVINPLVAQIVEAKKRALFQWLQAFRFDASFLALNVRNLTVHQRIASNTIAWEEVEAERMFNDWLLRFRLDIDTLFRYHNEIKRANEQAQRRQGIVIFSDKPHIQCSDIPFDIQNVFLNSNVLSNAAAPVVIIERERVVEKTVERERIVVQQVPSPFGIVDGKFFCQTEHKPLAIAFHRLLESGIDSAITSPLEWITKLNNAHLLNIAGKISSLKTTAKTLHVGKKVGDGENPELNTALRQFVEENYSKIKAASSKESNKITPV